jgi:hypothetical protein
MTAVRVDVLHVPKTGGTAVRHTLQAIARQHPTLRLHDHRTKVADCPPDSIVFVVVRDPLERFVSSFNSRLRRGRPRYDYAWTLGERAAFTAFRTPSALAEALSKRTPKGWLARRSMTWIQHLREPLSYWLGDRQQVLQRPKLVIGTTASLEADVKALLRLAGLPPDAVSWPDTAVDRHETPPGFARELTGQATANLLRWYAADLDLFRACLERREREATRLLASRAPVANAGC